MLRAHTLFSAPARTVAPPSPAPSSRPPAGWISRLLLLVLGVLWLLPLGDTAHAQVKASLVALKSTFPADSKELTVGLRLEHQAHWHTYWISPGTGYATSLTWDLPPGWSAGPIRWPAPHRVYDTSKNLAGNGFENITTLPVTLTPPRDLRPGQAVTLRAKAEWLMCKDVCIPGEAELSLTLTPTDPDAMTTANVTDSPAGEHLLAAVDALPAPLPADWRATATRLAGTEGKRVRLTLHAPQGTPALPSDPWFFAEDGAVAYDAAQTPIDADKADGALYAADLTIADYADPAPTKLVGVLTFAEGPAYRLEVPIQAATPSDGAASPPAPGAASTGGSSGTAGGAGGAGEGGPTAEAPALIGILALAFVGGLILNLMPCVFPVLGLKVLGFVQQAGSDRKKITSHGLVFTAGVLLSFWTLAAVLALLRAGGEQLGWGFQLQEPAFVFAMAVVLLAFALNMSGAFEFGLRATAIGGDLQQKQGLAGSFFTGVLATVVATPCSAPFLAPALGAALALPTTASFAVFTAIALGLAAPYLILAAFPAAVRMLPRPGAWMEGFKQGMAFLLYGTVGLMVWILAGQLSADGLLNALLALTLLGFGLWLYGRATAPASRPGRRRAIKLGLAGLLALGSVAWGWPRPAAPTDIVWEPWSAERVAELQKAGRPIYVDFTARWCFTCQTNKKAVFAGPGSGEVLKAFRDQKVATLRGDWTNRDPLITAELKRWDRAAVPFNLLYLPGKPEPKVLPELLTPSTVLDALAAASDTDGT